MNLTEISVALRKFFIIAAIAGAIFLLLRFLVGIAISYWKATHQPPPPPPNVRFQTLPQPKFSAALRSSAGLTFQLETIEGKLPIATAASKVYAMPKKLPSLLSAQRANTLAQKLGFPPQEEIVTATNYRYIDPKDPFRTFLVDIVNTNFQLNYTYQANPDIFRQQRQLTSKTQIENDIKRYLQANNLFDESILKGKTIFDLLTYDSDTGTLKKATSLSTAHAARLHFFRHDIDGLPLVTPKFFESFTFVTYVPAITPEKQMLEISFIFWPIAFDTFATYPLRSADTAWQDIRDGYGTVVSMDGSPDAPVVIRSIFLAYFDSQEPQKYLQPVFVFKGDNNFIAYLPAVSPEWLE